MLYILLFLSLESFNVLKRLSLCYQNIVKENVPSLMSAFKRYFKFYEIFLHIVKHIYFGTVEMKIIETKRLAKYPSIWKKIP